MSASVLDGGYGWVVALCCMFLMALQASTFSLFGVVYLDLVLYYETSKSIISWIGALMQFMYGVGGFICGTLLRKYGPSRVGLFVPFVATIAFIIPVFFSYLWTMFVCYSLLVGCAEGFFATIAISSVYPWFSKQRSLAISIVMMGVPLGAFVSPPLYTWLNYEYTWKGVFMICGGVQFQGLVFIALLRKPTVRPGKSSCPISQQNYKDDTKIQYDDREQRKANKSLCVWVKLCKDPSFIIMYICCFLMYTGHIVGFVFTITRGLLLGLTKAKAAVLSSIIGGVSGAGRLFSGLVGAHLGKKGRIFCLATVLIICGSASIASRFFIQFWQLAMYSAIWAFCAGIYSVYLLASYADLFDAEYAAEMVGLNQVCSGMSFLAAMILTGAMFDYSDDPSLPFTLFGGLQAFAGLLVFTVLFLKRQEFKRINEPVV